MERSPIFSAKQHDRPIGYIEGNAAFDLSGRLCANYSGKSGNLRALDTGRIVGYISLRGIFVGAFWLADELFPNHHDELIQQGGPRSGPGFVVGVEVFRQPAVDKPYTVDGIRESLRLPSGPSELASKLSSRSDDDAAQWEVVQRERHSNDHDPVIVNETFGQQNSDEVRSSPIAGETPSGNASIQGDFAAGLFYKTDDDATQEERYLNDRRSDVPREIFAQQDTLDVYPIRDADEAPSRRPPEQGEAAARPFSKSDEDAQQETIRQERYSRGPAPVVADEIFGQCEVEDLYPVGGIGATSSPPPSEQDEPAAHTIVHGELSTHDPTKDFFEVDLARAVGTVRNELGKVGYLYGPRLAARDMPDPTKDFFSVDVERAVGRVPNDLGKTGYASDPEPVVAGEIPDPAQDFFSVDVKRAVGMVRSELEKGSR